MQFLQRNVTVVFAMCPRQPVLQQHLKNYVTVVLSRLFMFLRLIRFLLLNSKRFVHVVNRAASAGQCEAQGSKTNRARIYGRRLQQCG